jgi:hypothetical protein
MTDGWHPATRTRLRSSGRRWKLLRYWKTKPAGERFEGVLKGVYYQGKLVGYELKYSDRLLVQLLKAHHPAHKPPR